MGIVQKGSFYSSILIGVGLFLGFVISGIHLPNYLTEEQNGVLSLLNSYSLIYSQITILGIHTAVIKFFPHFKNPDNQHHGFLSVISLVLLGSFFLFIIYFYLSKPFFEELFSNSPLLKDNLLYLLPLTFFTLYFTLFDNYSAANLKPTRGFLFRDVIQRLIVLAVLTVYILFQLNFKIFLFLYVLALCLPTVFFAIALVREKHFTWRIKWHSLYRDNWRYMAKVSGYSLLLGLTWVGINNIDSIMVERLLDLKSAGIYSRNMFFGILVSIPYRAIHKASSGIIAQAFKDNRLDQIRDIYYKSTLTQLILGIFIFGTIWLNIDNVYNLIPTSYKEGKYVIFFIGLGNLFTMLGGVNTAIINFSPYYRYNAYFVGILLILVVGLNYLLIPIFGVSGAAASTAFGYFAYNFMMWGLLLKKYNLQPFTKQHLLAVLIGLLCYNLVYFLPAYNSFVFDILARSILFGLIFALLIYKTKISPDINKLVKEIGLKIPLIRQLFQTES